MNLFIDFGLRVKAVLEQLESVKSVRETLDFSRIGVEPPRDASHGDIATNAAMVLAKPLGTNPRALAELIIAVLKTDPDISEVSVAGPGFINIRLSVGYWQKLLVSMVEDGELDKAVRSMWNMSRQIPQGPCMLAIAVAPWWAIRWPIF